MAAQQYEEYWKITLAYTDIYAEDFNESLRIILDFIDAQRGTFSSDKYEKLQSILKDKLKISEASVRKVINSYVKLGFVNSHLASYHPEARAFVDEPAQDAKKTLFSKIIYSNSSFSRSVTTESDKHELNFLVKTLTEVHSLNRTDILAMMTVNIANHPKGYLTKEELALAKQHAVAINFDTRKYNQVGHLWSVLGNLDDLVSQGGTIYLAGEAPEIEEPKAQREGRDPYLHRLYKNQLAEESIEKFGAPMCMLEKLAYPVLIASHIKPFIQSEPDEAYDPNNGLLLSKNMDVLFDLGYMSFQNDGTILLSERLDPDLKDYLGNYRLDIALINDKRADFLEFHRTYIFN